LCVQIRKKTRTVKTQIKRLLGSIPGEDIFCKSENNHDMKTASQPKSFVLARGLQWSKTLKNGPVYMYREK
jgi:hypothetical protein